MEQEVEPEVDEEVEKTSQIITLENISISFSKRLKSNRKWNRKWKEVKPEVDEEVEKNLSNLSNQKPLKS